MRDLIARILELSGLPWPLLGSRRLAFQFFLSHSRGALHHCWGFVPAIMAPGSFDQELATGVAQPNLLTGDLSESAPASGHTAFDIGVTAGI